MQTAPANSFIVFQSMNLAGQKEYGFVLVALGYREAPGRTKNRLGFCGVKNILLILSFVSVEHAIWEKAAPNFNSPDLKPCPYSLVIELLYLLANNRTFYKSWLLREGLIL